MGEDSPPELEITYPTLGRPVSAREATKGIVVRAEVVVAGRADVFLERHKHALLCFEARRVLSPSDGGVAGVVPGMHVTPEPVATPKSKSTLVDASGEVSSTCRPISEVGVRLSPIEVAGSYVLTVFLRAAAGHVMGTATTITTTATITIAAATTTIIATAATTAATAAAAATTTTTTIIATAAATTTTTTTTTATITIAAATSTTTIIATTTSSITITIATTTTTTITITIAAATTTTTIIATTAATATATATTTATTPAGTAHEEFSVANAGEAELAQVSGVNR